MSFTHHDRRAVRLARSKLFLPGSRRDFIEKAAKGDADCICMDLEDAVAPSDKLEARKNIIEALNEVDFGDKVVGIRINGLNTHYAYRDVIEIVEQGGERLDTIMIPKVGTGGDVYAIDMLVSQAEWAVGRKKKIGLEVVIESAMGIQNVDEICQASPRLESLHFGAADYAASANMRTTNIGGANGDYTVMTDPDENGTRYLHWGDMWHYTIARMVASARSYGLTPIDGPFGDYSDPDGLRNQALRTAVMGCEGKWAIHPKQVPLCNEIFTPPANEVDKAREILVAMQEAQGKGLGAATYKGTLLAAASIRQAEVIVRQVDLIAQKDQQRV